jgi:short-subunit dehydrogenase
MSRNLTNRTIIITGASSGIGAATAVACAHAGMNVLLNGRDAENLKRVADEVRQAGRRAEIVPGDVTAAGLNERLLDVADETLDGFYAVFANAGYGWKKPAHAVAMEELRSIFEVNFFASYDLVARAARRLLAREESGHLLMCSSAVAKFTMVNFSAYSATKAAQNHVCRAMRLELKRHGIAVSSVHPITTRTPFFERSAKASGEADVDAERVFDHVPKWMLQTSDQVARAVVRCLRRPVPEVWTSGLVRTVAGVITAFPRLADVVGRKG